MQICPQPLLYISHTQSAPKKLKLCHNAYHYAIALCKRVLNTCRPRERCLGLLNSHYTTLYVLEKGKLMHLFFHLLCRRMARNSNWAAITNVEVVVLFNIKHKSPIYFQMATQRSAKLKQFRSLPCCVPGGLWSQ